MLWVYDQLVGLGLEIDVLVAKGFGGFALYAPGTPRWPPCCEGLVAVGSSLLHGWRLC